MRVVYEEKGDSTVLQTKVILKKFKFKDVSFFFFYAYVFGITEVSIHQLKKHTHNPNHIPESLTKALMI